MEKNVLTKEDRGEIKSLIKPEEVIEKKIALSWDGKNIMIRLPKEIAEYFDVNEENRFEKMLVLKVKEYDGRMKKTFDIIKRNKPKRKHGKTTNKK